MQKWKASLEKRESLIDLDRHEKVCEEVTLKTAAARQKVPCPKCKE